MNLPKDPKYLSRPLFAQPNPHGLWYVVTIVKFQFQGQKLAKNWPNISQLATALTVMAGKKVNAIPILMAFMAMVCSNDCEVSNIEPKK